MTVLSRTFEEFFLEEIVWACNAKTHEGIWKPFFPRVTTEFWKTWAFWIYSCFLRIMKKTSPHTKIPKTFGGDMVIISMVVIISQCISMLTHQMIPLKYIKFLIIKYSSKIKNYKWLIVVNIFSGCSSNVLAKAELIAFCVNIEMKTPFFAYNFKFWMIPFYIFIAIHSENNHFYI